MTFVADIVRRSSVMLMLVAILGLASQAGAASAYAHRHSGDCPKDLHLSLSVDQGREAAAVQQGDGGHDHKSPCKSACCHAACSTAVLTDASTVQVPAPTAGGIAASAVQGAEGIDVKGVTRPPRPPFSV